jgi:hypothetical protein
MQACGTYGKVEICGTYGKVEICGTYGKVEICRQCFNSQTEGKIQLKDLSIEIILNWILKKWAERALTGLI